MTQTLVETPVVGSQTDADLAIAAHWSIEGRTPGVLFCGEGYYRTAYLVNGVVYKVENDPHLDPSNLQEWDNYRSLPDPMPAGFAVPKMHLYWVDYNGYTYPVIASEFIDGTPMGQIAGEIYDRYNDSLSWWARLSGLCDCWEYNVIVRDNLLYLIDLGQ
jgi:hypothetical protein